MYTVGIEKNISSLLNKIKDIPGDILELGVFTGTNTYIIGNYIKENSLDKKYVGFDSFEGYTEEDILSSNNSQGLRKNQDAQRWNISKTLVADNIKKRGLVNYCQIVVGDIKETVQKYLDKMQPSYKISMVYIDCNAYLPAITALEACKKYLSPGALLVVDEHNIGGETQALNKFCETTSVEIFNTGWKHPNGPRLFGEVK